MFNVSRNTFKQLVDKVLSWTGDQEDQAQMRALAEDAVRASHEMRLTNDRYTFMLFPKPQTFTTVAGQQTYSLHEAFLSPLYFHNVTKNKPVRPVAVERLPEFRRRTRGSIEYVALHNVGKVQAQPAAAGTLTATSSDPADNGKTVRVVGETSAGIQEEVLTLPNAGSVEFLAGGIIDVVKEGEEWLGTLTLTAEDGTEVLTLAAASYGRQFRQLYTASDMAGGEVVEYQFYRHPKPLVHNNDIPDTPYPFDYIHVLDALLKLSGFTRATAAEIRQWKTDLEELMNALSGQYSDSQATDSEVLYQTLVRR